MIRSRAAQVARWAGALVVLAGLLLPVIGPTIDGHRWIVVAGGSMEPTYSVGDVIRLRDANSSGTDPAQISVGDVVTFLIDDGRNVTHRVISRAGDELTTQGDANDVADRRPVEVSDVEGVINGEVPRAAAAVVRATEPWFIRLAMAGLLLTVLFAFPARSPHSVTEEPVRAAGSAA